MDNHKCVIVFSGTPPQASVKGKPDRFCPFCKTQIKNGKLTRHISLVHKDNDQVQYALKLPSAKERNRAFDIFKKKAYLHLTKCKWLRKIHLIGEKDH